MNSPNQYNVSLKERSSHAQKWTSVNHWFEAYRKLGVEVDFEERLDAEKKLRMDVEAQLEEEERSRQGGY
jgi:hypothetical protein